MKRVLFVLPVVEPSWATNQARLLVPHLLAAGYDVHVCTMGPDDAKPCRGLQVPSTALGGRGPLDPVVLRQLRRLIDRLTPRLVHAWLPTPEPRLRLLPLVDRRVRWLLSQAGFAPASTALQAHLERRHLSGVVDWTVSDPGAQARALEAGLDASRVHCIASGVEAAREPEQSRAQWIAALGLPPDVYVIGAIGRLRVERQWKDLIWAADMLKFIRRDVHLLICGAGPQRQRLERFRRQVRIADQVHFLGPRSDVPDWLPHLHGFWSGRADRGQPLALLEAMAAGVPSIATRLSGAEQVIRHGRSGFLVPVGDRAGIARLTRKLLDEPEYARTMAERGREHVAACFSRQTMADGFLRVYAAM
jgi:glycosyltransferase involved in cell wall biosynthesis